MRSLGNPGSRQVAITFDIDWSPDWIVEEVAGMLREKGLKSTWFVTHQSLTLDRMRAEPRLFELGIHPNCLPKSNHGSTEHEVMSFMRQLVQEAVSMRTHGLYQSTGFLIRAARDFGIEVDSSLLIPRAADLQTHMLQIGDVSLKRAPLFWEDDIEMLSPAPDWRVDESPETLGLRVYAFHPFHIVLNTVDYALYENLKSKCPLPKWTPEFLAPHRHIGVGPRQSLIDLMDSLKPDDVSFVRELE